MTEKHNPHHFPGANNRASRSQHNLLIEVKDLRTRFHIAEGTVHAVNGISFKLHECETLAIVGESGCGKSVSMMSVMGLIPIPPGEIASGEVYYHGRDLLKLSEKEMESLRGREIAMVFQDPMTALNPVLTIERQLSEPLRTHLGMDEQMARQRCRCAATGGTGRPASAPGCTSQTPRFRGFARSARTELRGRSLHGR